MHVYSVKTMQYFSEIVLQQCTVHAKQCYCSHNSATVHAKQSLFTHQFVKQCTVHAKQCNCSRVPALEEDIEHCGYTVPKDSQVLVNVWAIGRNSGLWETPSNFKPERFWELEIDVTDPDFELIPFGAGRRICLELPLAIRMVPVILGSLVKTFKWKLDGGIVPNDLDMEEKFGITMAKAQPLLTVPILLLQ
ncbi:Geraniol 8-hydroxylase [Capsicum baccatum]|uniref:Geraniol 8-hydroxylase n=1 Tax=Capsicum baccatum TaxID=33114 RepID=A0A2G2XCM6_CAPBA|nr:Geraniol 8-hydroxylase [Capsicum baccatum]